MRLVLHYYFQFYFLTACVPSKNETSSNSSKGSDKDGPIPVTIFTPSLSWDGKFESDVNEFTQLVEEKFNLKITWEMAPQDTVKRNNNYL